jgi:hypothetical protein
MQIIDLQGSAFGGCGATRDTEFRRVPAIPVGGQLI